MLDRFLRAAVVATSLSPLVAACSDRTESAAPPTLSRPEATATPYPKDTRISPEFRAAITNMSTVADQILPVNSGVVLVNFGPEFRDKAFLARLGKETPTRDLGAPSSSFTNLLNGETLVTFRVNNCNNEYSLKTSPTHGMPSRSYITIVEPNGQKSERLTLCQVGKNKDRCVAAYQYQADGTARQVN